MEGLGVLIFLRRLRAESLDYPGLGVLAVSGLCMFGLQLCIFGFGAEGSSHREIPSVRLRDIAGSTARSLHMYKQAHEYLSVINLTTLLITPLVIARGPPSVRCC